MRNRCKTLLRDHPVPEVTLEACLKHAQSQPYLRPSPFEDLKDLPHSCIFTVHSRKPSRHMSPPVVARTVPLQRAVNGGCPISLYLAPLRQECVAPVSTMQQEMLFLFPLVLGLPSLH